MTQFLLKLFVNNHTQTEDPAVRSAIGTFAGATGIVCNILLALAKLIAGLLGGSVAITADALNNFSDAASSVVALLGFRLARRPADADHPYGHARMEYLSGLTVSVLILLVGVELARASVDKILAPTPVEISVATLVVLGISVAAKLWMSLFFGKLGSQIRSTTLQAASVDSRNDVIATAAVTLGSIANMAGLWQVDGWIGLAVAVFIIISGIRSANETISPLLGQRADANLVEQISQVVLSHHQVLGIHDLLVHDYGPGQCYASVHAELSAQEDPLICHDIIDDIECDVLTQLNVHLVIHYDPVVIDDAEWDKMRAVVESIARCVDPRLSIHDFRIVRGASQKKLVFDIAVPYDMELPQVRRQIEKALEDTDHNYAAVIRFDRIS
jgi:cation diffusion facilitator family transporter